MLFKFKKVNIYPPSIRRNCLPILWTHFGSFHLRVATSIGIDDLDFWVVDFIGFLMLFCSYSSDFIHPSYERFSRGYIFMKHPIWVKRNVILTFAPLKPRATVHMTRPLFESIWIMAWYGTISGSTHSGWNWVTNKHRLLEISPKTCFDLIVSRFKELIVMMWWRYW